MSPKLIVIVAILPVLWGQVYYPDEQVGGFVQPLSGRHVEASSFVASPPIPENLPALRGTTEYENFVNRLISTGILRLTLAVDKAVATTSQNNYDNIVYAPVSIAAALALILLGSNGRTFDEIATVMGLTTGVDIQNKSQIVHEQFGRMIQHLQATSGFNIGSQVNFATAVFVQNNFPIRRAYKRTAETLYDSEVLNVDFKSNPQSAQQVVNAWVAERTKGKINQLLSDPPSSATRVVLASAMYFKAEWEKPFYDGGTRRRHFFSNGRDVKSDVMVEMMANGGEFPYFKDSILNCEILGLPYRGNQTTMYVVVPNESNQQRLKELEAQLTPNELERLVANVKPKGATILFPKMEIDSTIDLRRSLQQMGLNTLFNPAVANLALLSPGMSDLGTSQRGAINIPIAANTNSNEGVLIFSRTGETVNCTQIFDTASNISTCQEVVNGTGRVTYKRFGSSVGRRIAKRESLDEIRQYLNQQSNPDTFENPGLYVDNVIHKVYMDITESGTEAAAATAASLSRDGSRVNFRVDVPFFFFIMHEETRTMLFWGSVHTPSPSFKSN